MQVTSEFSSAFMHNGELPSSDIMMLGHWAASEIQHSVNYSLCPTDGDVALLFKNQGNLGVGFAVKHFNPPPGLLTTITPT